MAEDAAAAAPCVAEGKGFSKLNEEVGYPGKAGDDILIHKQGPPMLPSWLDPSVCRCHNISSHLLSAQKYRLHSELARRLLAS